MQMEIRLNSKSYSNKIMLRDYLRLKSNFTRLWRTNKI